MQFNWNGIDSWWYEGHTTKYAFEEFWHLKNYSEVFHKNNEYVLIEIRNEKLERLAIDVFWLKGKCYASKTEAKEVKFGV